MKMSEHNEERGFERIIRETWYTHLSLRNALSPEGLTGAYV
jgi:hypothetical protein